MKYEKYFKTNPHVSIPDYILNPRTKESMSMEESLLLGRRLQGQCINSYFNGMIIYIKEILDEVSCALKIQIGQPKNFTSDKTDYSKSIKIELISKKWWNF